MRSLPCSSATALVAAATMAALAAPAAMGQAADGVLDKPEPSVADLLKRLDVLEERNKELEGKVTDLTRQQGEEWLGEQRAAQIREVVRDVLADSEQRASLRDGGMTAGWNDGFFLASNDGRFRMNVGGFVQSRFIWSSIQEGPPTGPPSNGFVQDRQVNRYGFDVPDLQLWADGHVFSRDFQYMVKARFSQGFSTELTKGPNSNFAVGGAEYRDVELLDAWIRVNLDDHWSARFGQFRTPFSRGFLVLEQYQMAASRSVVDYHYALGYTQGLELEYAADEARVRMAVNNGEQDQLLGDVNINNQVPGGAYAVFPTGSYGAANAPFWAQTSSYSFTGRVDWKPSGQWDQFRSYTSPAMEEFGMLLGAGFHVQQSYAYQPNNSNGPIDPSNFWVTATADAQLNFGGASFYGAFFYNYLNSPGAISPLFGSPQNASGNLGSFSIYAFQTMVSAYIAPKMELFGRYEFAMIDGIDASDATISALSSELDPLNLLTVGFNWYLDGQDLKWTTDLGWAMTAVHPWFADIEAGWRPSASDEVVFRTQLQLMF
ncbi:MAG: hypothetical protein FGM39_07475 [Phycisphaerales bacterium]|nr:hypothetical protein [Phycisphaerales bacterium]